MAKVNGRGVRLGKYIAKAIIQFSKPDFQEAMENPVYMKKFKKSMKPDFEAKKKDAPKTEAHESELEKIPYETFNVCCPEHLGALLRESCHMAYNAYTANRIKNSILEDL